MATPARSIEELQRNLVSACGARLQEITVERGDLIASVRSSDIFEVLSLCKADAALAFNMLVDLTAIDWMDSRSERFEVVYQLLSLSNLWRLTLRVAVGESKPELPSATPLWNGANFLEREVWDMFGIRFQGHPDLRRILMYEEFVGHPLRKDYPVQAKQPRVPLRMPEVENTARRMIRADLVTIRGRKPAGSRQEAR